MKDFVIKAIKNKKTGNYAVQKAAKLWWKDSSCQNVDVLVKAQEDGKCFNFYEHETAIPISLVFTKEHNKMNSKHSIEKTNPLFTFIRNYMNKFGMFFELEITDNILTIKISIKDEDNIPIKDVTLNLDECSKNIENYYNNGYNSIDYKLYIQNDNLMIFNIMSINSRYQKSYSYIIEKNEDKWNIKEISYFEN